MRTPGIIIIGLVLAPCGWVLDLTSTVAPNWRTLHKVSNQPSDTVINQGIWDICKTYTSSSSQNDCNLRSTDQLYFNNQVIPVAQGMMVASLVVTALGLAVVAPGARCWTDQSPRWIVVGVGGVLIFCSGALTIIPIAWYTHLLTKLNTTTTFTDPQNPDIRVGYCIVLGYIGGILEVIAGVVLFIGIFQCCGGRNRGEKRQESRPQRDVPRITNPTPYPRSNLSRYESRNPPRSVSSSTSSSSPYSVNDEHDYPRANGGNKGRVNPAYNSRPYDADL
ncbi:claudin-23-like [Trichomycterus rosablanca]|uniref:claudin-23-like n=1 Tax=Trichomycterus rosablanca TaxID=2290929 RepID=UPI002F359B0E